MKSAGFFEIWMLCAVVALTLGGCSDANVDLQRQVSALTDEIERLKSAKVENGGGKDQDKGKQDNLGSNVKAVADEQTVKANFETMARELKAAVEAGISNARFESITLFQPNYEPHPHRAEFSMEFSSSGIRFSIDHIPVKASVDGVWIFPGVDDVLAQVSRARLAAMEPPPSSGTLSTVSNRSAQPGAVSSGRPSEVTNSGGVGGAFQVDRTVVIEWEVPRRSGASAPVVGASSTPNDDRARSSSVESPRSAPPPRNTTPSPSSPEPSRAAPMPFQREVQIKF